MSDRDASLDPSSPEFGRTWAHDKPAEPQPVSEKQQEDARRSFGADPMQPGHDEQGLVHMPGVLADMYGIPRSTGRMMLTLGTIHVDDVAWEGDRFDFPYEAIKNKEILIEADVRSVKFTYNG